MLCGNDKAFVCTEKKKVVVEKWEQGRGERAKRNNDGDQTSERRELGEGRPVEKKINGG